MILYYAVGGGLGHLTRARAVLHTLEPGRPATIITASRFAEDRRVVGDAGVVRVPEHLADHPAEYRGWLQGLFGDGAHEVLYIDAFPGGIVGEFCDFPFPEGLPIRCLARLLRWDAYCPVMKRKPPRFERSYLLEPLESGHERFIRESSGSVLPLLLADPPDEDSPAEALKQVLQQVTGKGPLWLIVHSETRQELGALLRYAREMAAIEGASPRLVVVTPDPTDLREEPGVHRLDYYPAASLFPFADRIISGCGFNTMRQVAPWRAIHRPIPFRRRYDNQFERARRHR